MKLGTMAAAGVVVLTVAACSSAATSTAAGSAASSIALAQPSMTSDPYGASCATLDSQGYCPFDDPTTDPNGQTCQPTAVDTNGYCPGDSPPQQTDPNGNTCTSLDSLGYCPGDDPSPTPTMTKQTDIVVFSVSGSGTPSIQYGTDSSTNNPSEGAGPLGDGVYLPWHASMRYDSGALYYAVSAQLQGGGSIIDSVTEVVTTYCSNGHHKTESFPLANGSASGGYGIAQAEYSNLGSGTGNASQAESDAGC